MKNKYYHLSITVQAPIIFRFSSNFHYWFKMYLGRFLDYYFKLHRCIYCHRLIQKENCWGQGHYYFCHCKKCWFLSGCSYNEFVDGKWIDTITQKEEKYP